MITFITLNIYNVLSSLDFRLCAVKQSLHSVLGVLRCLWVAFLSYSSVTQQWTSRKNTGCPVIALNVFAVGEQSQAVGAATKWLPTVCACNTFNLWAITQVAQWKATCFPLTAVTLRKIGKGLQNDLSWLIAVLSTDCTQLPNWSYSVTN